MRDFEKYQSLHAVIMLQDVIRKWWGLDPVFADEDGIIADHASGRVMPPNNDFCRLSLFSREGFERCQMSVRVLGEKFRASKKPRRCLFHDCHLGFTVVGCPIVIGGHYAGFIFVDGFARETMTADQLDILKQRVRTLNPGATDLDRAVTRLPLLTPDAIEKLCDLLELGADEIAAFEADFAKAGSDQSQAHRPVAEEVPEPRPLVGDSAAVHAVREIIARIEGFEPRVLIRGEPGTGRTLVARTLHAQSPRAAGPFVVQRCAGLDQNTLDAELFAGPGGTVGGLGGFQSMGGLLAADGGTLLLDELLALSPRLQAKLAGFLEEGAFRPTGGRRRLRCDVRVIAATAGDPERALARRELREDLYHRLRVVEISLPPLRERLEDLPALAAELLRVEGEPPAHLGAGLLESMKGYHWPGNVRELEGEIERWLLRGECRDAPRPAFWLGTRPMAPSGRDCLTSGRSSGNLKGAVEALERELLRGALDRHQGNKTRAARELGISRGTLIAKCERYGIVRTKRE